MQSSGFLSVVEYRGASARKASSTRCCLSSQRAALPVRIMARRSAVTRRSVPPRLRAERITRWPLIGWHCPCQVKCTIIRRSGSNPEPAAPGHSRVPGCIIACIAASRRCLFYCLLLQCFRICARRHGADLVFRLARNLHEGCPHEIVHHRALNQHSRGRLVTVPCEQSQDNHTRATDARMSDADRPPEVKLQNPIEFQVLV